LIERLTGFELGQDLLANFFEVLGCVTLAILEIEDDMVYASRTQRSKELEHDIPTAAETEVEWLRRGVRVVSQINVERLGKGKVKNEISSGKM
jgi:hypothetical protein